MPLRHDAVAANGKKIEKFKKYENHFDVFDRMRPLVFRVPSAFLYT